MKPNEALPMSHSDSETLNPREPVSAVILAAGRGVRMGSALPKVLHAVAGRAMVLHVLDAVGALGPQSVTVVIGAGMEAVAKAVAPARTVVQDPPLGTGHAVMAAAPGLKPAIGTVLVLFGDTPLVTADTLKRLVLAREAGAAVVALGFRPKDPAEYGRLIQAPDGSLLRNVEFKDASLDERAIPLCNAGAMAVSAEVLVVLLGKLDQRNAQGEYYLPDLIAHARSGGMKAAVIEADADEVMGVNARSELARAEALMQTRLREAAMAAGATLIDPDTVYFSADTVLGRDVVVGPHVVFGPGVTVADNVTINAFCHFTGAKIAQGAILGPFARLRPGADIGPDAHIGNFVEIKNSIIEAGVKANHLTYVGDARVGAGSNLGAGTITCNYDGYGKYRTDIGANVFIGSDVALVAPVKVGDGAYVGAGSVVTEDVPADALAVGRGRMAVKEGWAKRFRARKEAERASRKKDGP
jgi:bifunctional UDP-N-acetylglucosamine pyrophosphorylase/glucosamine-1-phosphate N-acetyltransferase